MFWLAHILCIFLFFALVEIQPFHRPPCDCCLVLLHPYLFPIFPMSLRVATGPLISLWIEDPFRPQRKHGRVFDDRIVVFDSVGRGLR